MSWRIIEGDCIEAIRGMDAASVDAIVTDPPYGLGFMGREWDDLPPGLPWAQECLRVLKPGGHLLAFGGTRTYHRLTCAIEDAGFEIRDCIAWMYGSGFPKSLDVSKAIDKAAGAEREVVGFDATKARPNKENYAKRTDRQPSEAAAEGWKDNGATLTAPATPDAERWQGWGTALKPAFEPIVVARKPLVGTVAGNMLAHGTGALNVAGCRIGVNDESYARNHSGDRGHNGTRSIEGRGATDLRPGGGSASDAGRWPANVVLDPEAGALLDEQTGELLSGANPTRRGSNKFGSTYGAFEGQRDCVSARGADAGGASRFFYCAKAGAGERSAGLTTTSLFSATDAPDRNDHPTVKPIDLMRWLVRLVTPPGGLVLDPYAGSGTTGIAASLEGFGFIGIEREARYAAIARARLAHWTNGSTEAVS